MCYAGRHTCPKIGGNVVDGEGDEDYRGPEVARLTRDQLDLFRSSGQTSENTGSLTLTGPGGQSDILDDFKVQGVEEDVTGEVRFSLVLPGQSGLWRHFIAVPLPPPDAGGPEYALHEVP